MLYLVRFLNSLSVKVLFTVCVSVVLFFTLYISSCAMTTVCDSLSPIYSHYATIINMLFKLTLWASNENCQHF